MFYETAHTIGPGWHKSFKPSHYDDMTWSPSSKHFRSPGGSPQNYRRIIHPDDSDRNNEDDLTFGGRNSPTFPRKIFRDIWDDTPNSNHRFSDRPRLFKRVFRPNRWEDEDDDFERTRNSVRQMAREFGPDFDSRRLERDFDSDFHHRDRNLKTDFDEEFEKAAGRVHHIPIMVERRIDEMRSKFGRDSPPPEKPDCEEDSEDWQGPQVQRLKKNFERDDFSPLPNRRRAPRVDLNKPRAFTSPITSQWDPDSVHTLPIRRSSKSSKLYDEPSTPKSVFRSYSETHEDIPKQHPQHAAAFRSHSDGHCPKTTYVTKISVNLPSNDENSQTMTNGDLKEGLPNRDTYDEYNDSNNDEWDSHQSRQRTRCKVDEEPKIYHNTVPKTAKNSQQNDASDLNSDHTTKHDEVKSMQERASMQQITSVLQNVDDLIVHVEGYNGTGRDKQFRFLDEMLTRCMLRLDDVDTEGKDDIRTARKAAVMQVQSCIEKLESKANECEQRNRQEFQQEEEEQQTTDDRPKDVPTQEDEQGNEEQAPDLPESDEVIQETSTPEDNEQTRL